MSNEITPADVGAVVSSSINALAAAAREQSETQREQIRAETERQRVHVEAMERQAVREFRVIVGALATVAVSIGVLLYAGQYQLAYNCIAFFAGSGLGYGLGKARRT